MSDYSDNLKKLVISFHDNFKEIEDLLTSKHPAPGKWSSKEILGHLIDSAANNHRRFVQAAYQDDFVFDGYDQDKWVAVQRYNEVPWIFLLDLWKSYNLHLARIMEVIPQQTKIKERHPHNLNKIAWKTVPADEPATLEYFMIDYIGHLQNHLKQIEAILEKDKA